MIAVAFCCAAVVLGQTRAEDKITRMKLGDKTYDLELLFHDAFDQGMSNWTNLNPKTQWEVRDGVLRGKWGDGGSVVWLRPVFEGNVLVMCRTESLEPSEQDWKDFGSKHRKRIPEGGQNLNLFMLCSGPKGEDMAECYPGLLKQGTGPNGMGEDQYNGYFFTYTLWWSRFRYLPGYKCASEWRGDDFIPPGNGKVHDLVALRDGSAIRYFINGRLVHDFEDKKPHTRGQMGFCLWRNAANIYEFNVYRIRGSNTAY